MSCSVRRIIRMLRVTEFALSRRFCVLSSFRASRPSLTYFRRRVLYPCC